MALLATTTEGQTPPTIRAIDTLLFRLSGASVSAVAGAGYYIDNVLITDTPPAPIPDPTPAPETDEAACAYNTNASFDMLLMLLLACGIFYGSNAWMARR